MDTAIIGLLAGLLGIALSNGLTALIELRRRHQRTIDLVTAVHAEIMAGIDTGSRQLTADEQAYARANPTPFATPDDSDFVFQSIKGDISLLPVEVIHDVVRYYRLAVQSNLTITDMRDPLFIAQTPGEKMKFIDGFIALATMQREAGKKALAALEAYATSYGIRLSDKRSAAASSLRSDDGNDRSAHG